MMLARQFMEDDLSILIEQKEALPKPAEVVAVVPTANRAARRKAAKASRKKVRI